MLFFRWIRSMGSVLRQRQENKRKQLALQQQCRELAEELQCCSRALQSNEAQFAIAGDPHMIESCIYQRQALRARHDGLVLQARQLYAEYAGSAGQPVRIK